MEGISSHPLLMRGSHPIFHLEAWLQLQCPETALSLGPPLVRDAAGLQGAPGICLCYSQTWSGSWHVPLQSCLEWIPACTAAVAGPKAAPSICNWAPPQLLIAAAEEK